MNKLVFSFLKLFLILFSILGVLQLEMKIGKNEYQSTINLIITINGILISIITSFIFSKILLERSERIKNKTKIDIISLELNHLRRIAKVIRGSRNFWMETNRELSFTYPNIDVFNLRKLNNEQSDNFFEKVKTGQLNSQAFLATKFLEGIDSLELSKANYRKNYNIKTLNKYDECCSFIFSYTEEHNDEISLENWAELKIKKNLKSMNYILDTITPQNIGELFSEFSTSNIKSLKQLTLENEKGVSNIFNWLFFNLVFSFIIFIVSMFGLVYLELNELKFNIIIIGTIWTIIDLVLNTFYSIKKELKIEKFYI